MTNRKLKDAVESYRFRIEDSTAKDASNAVNRRMTPREIIDAHNQQTYRRQIKKAILVFIGMSVFAFFIAAPLTYLILKSGNPRLSFMESLLGGLPIVIAVSLLLGVVFTASAIMRRPPTTSSKTARSIFGSGTFWR